MARAQPQLRPRLLATDISLLAKHDVDAAPRKKERRRHSDDAAADHHDIGARRKGAVGLDPVNSRHHEVVPC